MNILQRMDSAPIAVRICCIKFVQKVVQVETPGVISDPRVSCYYYLPILFIPANVLQSVRIKMRHPLPLCLGHILCYNFQTWRPKHLLSWTGC